MQDRVVLILVYGLYLRLSGTYQTRLIDEVHRFAPVLDELQKVASEKLASFFKISLDDVTLLLVILG